MIVSIIWLWKRLILYASPHCTLCNFSISLNSMPFPNTQAASFHLIDVPPFPSRILWSSCTKGNQILAGMYCIWYHRRFPGRANTDIVKVESPVESPVENSSLGRIWKSGVRISQPIVQRLFGGCNVNFMIWRHVFVEQCTESPIAFLLHHITDCNESSGL